MNESTASISMLTIDSLEVFVTDELVEERINHSTHGYWQGSHYISKGYGGYWSKWGGARKPVWQEQLVDFWFCQSCGEKQPTELSPYKFEYPKGEYIRICAHCFSDKCCRMFGHMLQTA